MGLVNQGIPREMVQDLARLTRASVFVETGTFQGATARWAASVFEQVHTIELSRQLYEQSAAELSALKGVEPHFGDSAKVLPSIVSGLGDRRAIFWLDGHWSGGETAGAGSECPLMAELECLAGRRDDIILIDDARLFLCAPPKPHQPEQWPTVADIVHVFDREGSRPKLIQIIEDVIYIVPAETALKETLIDYAQSLADHSPQSSGHKRIQKLATKLLRV